MDKRSFKRITAGYKASIKYGDQNGGGLIENLSESGINLLSDLADPPLHFHPGETVELSIETPSSEPLTLSGTIMWAHVIPPHNVRSTVGLKIIDPPWEKKYSFL